MISTPAARNENGIKPTQTRETARQNVIETWKKIKPLDAPVNFAALEEAQQLKRETSAVFVVHSYQRLEIKGVGDLVGDSFTLAKYAESLPKGATVIHCTVEFMAETTKILRPDLRVIVPSYYAGCGLAEYISGEQIRAWKANEAAMRQLDESQLPLVLYINSYADAKAEATVICTSSNSLKVVQSLPQKHVLFAPDKNLYYAIRDGASKAGKELIPWEGTCPIHAEFTVDMVDGAIERAEGEIRGTPKIGIMVHPECNPEVREYVLANRFFTSAVLSTDGMKSFAKEHPEIDFWIVGTEIGLIESLRVENPGKKFEPVYKHKSCDESCVCPYMKSISIEGVVGVLRALKERSMDSLLKHGKIIEVKEEYMTKAKAAIERMVAIGRGDAPPPSLHVPNAYE